MALEQRVAFPMAKRRTTFNLFWPAFNSDPVWEFAEARFLRSAFAITVVPVPTETSKVATLETNTMDQVIDPLVTDLHWNIHTAREPGNLLRAPVFFQPFGEPARQPLHSFVTLEGGSTPGVRLMLAISGSEP